MSNIERQMQLQRAQRQALRAGVTRGLNPVAQSLKNLGVQGADIRAETFFVYQTAPIVTAASGTSSAVIQIQADSVFEVIRVCFLTFQGALFVAQVAPPILVQVSDTSSGANLFDSPIPIHTLAYGGGGGDPFDIPSSRFFAPNASLTVFLTNLDSANAYTTRVNFQGRKLYA